MGFAPGQLIIHRNVHRGRIAWVRPARVVADDERGLLVWVARGTPVAGEVAADGRGLRSMPFAEWIEQGPYRLAEGTWAGPPVLKFLPVGARHSVWWFRDEAGEFRGWYVNLEEPGVRWDDGELAGVDIVDQDLDIVVLPDRSWEWKDEGEFTERLGYPDHYWVRDEAAVWAEGRRVLKQVEAGEFPFDGTLVDFTPDPAWTPPLALPRGWDRPPAVS